MNGRCRVAFDDESLLDALNRSLRNVKHLRARDAAAVAAARALAAKIDAWDEIVQWAVEDQSESGAARPAVPANDNVSLGSFLKYLDALQLLPPVAPVEKGSARPKPKDQLQAMRERLQAG